MILVAALLDLLTLNRRFTYMETRLIFLMSLESQLSVGAFVNLSDAGNSLTRLFNLEPENHSYGNPVNLPYGLGELVMFWCCH